MTGTVITLIVIGLIFIFASFFISEAVSDSMNEETVVEPPDISLSEQQRLRLKQEAEEEIRDSYEALVYQFGEQLSSISNEKTLALGDYAVSVCDEIDKNHKEAMFLYSMLGDKEKELKMLVEQVDALKQEIQETSAESKKLLENAVRASKEAESPSDPFEETMKGIDEMEVDFTGLYQERPANDDENANDLILELKKSGMSIIEIAKQLGLGVGEVKLVVDLYEGGK